MTAASSGNQLYSSATTKQRKNNNTMMDFCSPAKEEQAESLWLISFISLLRGASFDIQCILSSSCASYENVYIVQIPEIIQHFIHLKAFRDR